jgi:hypothetical protein
MRDDSAGCNLTRKYEPVNKEELGELKARIDRATGSALLQKGEQAAAGGLVGVSSTVLPQRAAVQQPSTAPAQQPSVFTPRAPSALPQRPPIGGGGGGGVSSPAGLLPSDFGRSVTRRSAMPGRSWPANGALRRRGGRGSSAGRGLRGVDTGRAERDLT